MHLFADESGGCSPSQHCFLVSGVLLDQTSATLVMKRFRKSANLKGEVHGHELTPKQRGTFFQLLRKHGGKEVVAKVVICERTSSPGGWAMGTRPEHLLRAEMILEVYDRISRRATQMSFNLTHDGGRYKKADLQEAQKLIVERILKRNPHALCQYGDSKKIPGLQVADIIANTAYRAHNGDANSDALLRAIPRQGIKLAERCPWWQT